VKAADDGLMRFSLTVVEEAAPLPMSSFGDGKSEIQYEEKYKKKFT
jgi:hypothetical protein